MHQYIYRNKVLKASLHLKLKTVKQVLIELHSRSKVLPLSLWVCTEIRIINKN